MSNLIGQTLGPYRIIEQIGIGGMATVYKAYQPSMDRYVAIKVLPAVLSRDPAFSKRFRREAKVVAKLEHKHILPVYDYGEQEGLTYLVMRYVEAGTLKDRLAAGRLDLPEIYRIIAQVGSALDYAHRLGVIHRDVKPSNVLIDSQGDAYLTDFGLARIVESSEQLTATGVGVGTPAYMAPEQGQGLKIDHRSDVYSLGVMLYEMVTGRVPYQAETPMAVVIKHITEPLPLPRTVAPDVPEEVERVILKALAKKPEDRFQTVREMVEALDFAVRAATAAAPTAARAEREAIPPAPAAPARGIRWPWDARTTALGVGITALALLVIGGMFLALSRIQYRVQVVGGRVEVVPVSTEAVAPVETPTSGVAVAATATPRPTEALAPTSTPTPRPTPTPGTVAVMPPSVEAMKWEQLSDPSPFTLMTIRVLAVDPNDPNTVFAGTYGAGIYVSRDGGETWELSNEGLGKGTVGSIVVDPNDSKVVYAALFDEGGVYKSTDGGRTWKAINRGLNLDGVWNELIYLDPTDNNHLYYTGMTAGLYMSNDGGETWQLREQGCPSVTALVIDPDDGEHLYAGSYGPPGSECLAGVHESRDGGRTWERLTTEEMAWPGDQYGGDWWHIAVDPRNFTTIYAGGAERTFKSTDGGQTWSPILDRGCAWLDATENSVFCGLDGMILISSDGGASWREIHVDVRGGQEGYPFAVAPGDPAILYAGGVTVIKSTDGGWSWSPTGWPVVAAWLRLTVDPGQNNRLFLSTWDFDPSWDKVYRSEDGGQTWQEVFSNEGWLSARITIDPGRNIIYRPDGDKGLLYRSKDNGQTWEQFGSGYLTHNPWQLVPDPGDGRKLWLIGQCGTGLAVSEDDGETFIRAPGFPYDVCLPILLVHPDGQRMYIVARGSFYRSDDGGETWRTGGNPGGIYRAAALDPSNPDVVYIGSTHKGVFKTENGGFSWRQVNAGLTNPSVNELAVDPAHPNVIYAATDGGVFVSVDGGEHWWPVQEGLGPNPVVYSIAVDPHDSSKVYAATPDGIFRLVGAPPEAAAPTPTPTPQPTSTPSSQAALPTPAPITPSGRVLHVDASAPAGGDGSQGAPFNAIQTAIDAAGPADTIKVAVGTYDENLDIRGKTLILRGGYDPATWEMTGSPEETVVDGGERRRTILVAHGSRVYLEGITVSGGRTCIVYDRGGGGILLESSTEATIRRTIIRNNSAQEGCGGGGVEMGPSTVMIIDSIITGNVAGNGGGINFLAGNLTVINTTIAGNSPDGIDTSRAAGEAPPLVVNTILWNNGETDIRGTNLRLRSSLIGRAPSGVQAENSLVGVDPRFVDPAHGDYHLRPDSPAIDAGTLKGAPAVDIDGDPRPVGEGVDIGADEVVEEGERAVPTLVPTPDRRVRNPENGHLYLLYPEWSKTWHQARDYCAARGGHLVTIGSASENEFVYQLSGGFTWLGATDEAEEGAWVWVTGEPWDFTNWHEGEPNNCASAPDGSPGCFPEHYLTFSSAPETSVPETTWNDVPDGEMPFVCEWEPVSP